MHFSKFALFLFLSLSACSPASALPASLAERTSSWARTTPTTGYLVVRPTPSSGEYQTISAAVAAIGSTGGNVFIYPGVYNEQVVINKTGPVIIQGYTANSEDYQNNQVTISNNINAVSVNKSNDLSGTVRAISSVISLYNLNIENTYGHYAQGCQCQAIALSAQNKQQGYYGVNLSGYQDTLLANSGSQIYAKSYISGAVDFIFGQKAPVYFIGSHIASTAPGAIVAPGNVDPNIPQVFVFDQCDIVLDPGASANTTGNVFLGRPWKAYGKAVFKNSSIGDHVNPAGWEIWSEATPNVNQSILAEFKTHGLGSYAANNASRASFAKLLTSDQAKNYTIDAVLGFNYTIWVDASYL